MLLIIVLAIIILAQALTLSMLFTLNNRCDAVRERIAELEDRVRHESRLSSIRRVS